MIIADSMPVACVYDVMLFSITQRNLPFAILENHLKLIVLVVLTHVWMHDRIWRQLQLH